MIEKLMPKGWTSLVDEAVTRILREEIRRALDEKFPEVKDKSDHIQPGFNYSMRGYIETRWTEIMKADPEIDGMIRDGLRDAIVNGFKTKHE